MHINATQVQLLTKGDRATQKLVFEQLFNTMFRVCHRYLARTDEAEDCVMKGFLKAFQQINRFEYQREGSFEGWLRRIMVNEALMTLRRNNNFNLVAIDDQALDVSFDDKELSALDARYLHDAIAGLPTGYRTVFNLYVVEGYSHQEIAAQLNITESTSKTQLAKAKAKLKQVITTAAYGYEQAQ